MGARVRTGGIGFLLLVGCVARIANFASDVAPQPQIGTLPRRHRLEAIRQRRRRATPAISRGMGFHRLPRRPALARRESWSSRSTRSATGI
jgi:hypothetical protein